MPLGEQPSGRRGTVGHPYSALNLRLALAGFGLVIFAVLTVVSLRLGLTALGVICAALAVIAAVDLIVIQLRRRARRRSGRDDHSLFE
jgi:FtsH-binding integral membrane protein